MPKHLTLRLVAEIPLKLKPLREYVVSIAGQDTPNAIITCEARSNSGAKRLLWRSITALGLDRGNKAIRRSDLRARLFKPAEADLYKNDYSHLGRRFREFDLEYKVRAV